MARQCKRWARTAGIALLASLGLAAGPADDAPGPADEPGPNGFRLTDLRVPRAEIRAGGPPRDGIRSVDSPAFAALADAGWVGPRDPVIGLAAGDDARAYPVHVMERHQIVNDVVDGKPVVVTYDPLSGAPLAFDRELGDRTLEFGVSGLLHNAGFLLYDRATESLWIQFTGEAVAGLLAGRRLQRRRVRQELLGSWAGRHPETRVLARPDPSRIDYRHSPYERYWTQNRAPFPVKAEDRRFHAKELVVGVVADGEVRAYLGSLVTAAGGRLEDRLGKHAVTIDYDSADGVFRWEIPAAVQVTEAYWFAWKAFRPRTSVWRDPGELPELPQD